MPKGKIENKGRPRINPTRANKIGGRKSTIGAAHLSVTDLRSKLKGGRGKDRVRARQELERRGLPLVEADESESV